MLQVHAGDWKPGPAGVGKTMGGRLKRLVMSKGMFRHERIKPNQIETVEIVTQGNETSVLGKVAWGAAGAVTLGGLGLLAGVIGGGNKSVMTVILRLKDGRSALISGKSKEIHLLMAAAHGASSN